MSKEANADLNDKYQKIAIDFSSKTMLGLAAGATAGFLVRYIVQFFSGCHPQMTFISCIASFSVAARYVGRLLVSGLVLDAGMHGPMLPQCCPAANLCTTWTPLHESPTNPLNPATCCSVRTREFKQRSQLAATTTRTQNGVL
jgi:hypothetical protein